MTKYEIQALASLLPMGELRTLVLSLALRFHYPCYQVEHLSEGRGGVIAALALMRPFVLRSC